MAETIVSPDHGAWERTAQLLEELLPVTGSESLLLSVAELWSRENGDCPAAASAVDAPNGRLLVGYAPGKAAASFHVCAWSRGAVWDRRAVDAAMARIGLPPFPTDAKAFPFGAQAPRGGVVLGGGGDDANAEDLRWLANVCGRLVEQALRMDARLPAEELEEAKFEALAEFAAGAGHEINNPVATICGRVQLLLADESDPHRRQALQTIGGQALRIRDMIGDLMVFGRPPQPELESISLQVIAEEVLSKLTTDAAEQDTRLETRFEAVPPVLADPVQAAIVVSNLVRNSLEALRSDGSIVLSIGEAPSKMVRLSVADDGPGLTPEEREHIFDPFFSGRQAGRCLGFGLPKCRRIVENHGGRISVSEPQGGGLIVCTDWPLAGADSSSKCTPDA
jgi:signal transduction histidine kinase